MHLIVQNSIYVKIRRSLDTSKPFLLIMFDFVLFDAVTTGFPFLTGALVKEII